VFFGAAVICFFDFATSAGATLILTNLQRTTYWRWGEWGRALTTRTDTCIP
jgi:hypothetical protein